jgi:FkbM family methyltransferase
MDHAALSARNSDAVKAVRDKVPTAHDIEQWARAYPFRGFVDCVAARGDQGFVMFNNADDIVAAHYLYLGPASFEPGTLMLWSHLARQSRWVYDIGAFSGVFALAAIAANGDCRAMAFEPSFVTFARLLVNIQANGFDGCIAPLRAGLGAAVGAGELRHSAGIYVMGSNETFVPEKIGQPWFSESVPILTLDHILSHQDELRSELVIPTRFEGADLIKIDVEGFEFEVLTGMRETLEMYRPVVIVEVLDDQDRFENVEEIMARIEVLRACFGADWRVFHIDEASGALSQRIGGRNHLFIHESKIGWLRSQT